ncbi:unnamed protein product [Rotaria socialis]|uniref:ceramidase n=2 Tax=Rotaria socialis TaxID=392032 RepID=A0A818EJ59_9BILA|nr:unnamed protein product [Rotaria socialis]
MCHLLYNYSIRNCSLTFLCMCFYFSSGWPIGFLVREILESIDTYDLAVEQLAQTPIIAPCYFTICGTSQCKTFGTLITRRQTSEENRCTLIEHGPIVQANIDHWSSNKDEDILSSIQRRAVSKRFLDNMKPMNEYKLWKLLSEYPRCNEITIYGTFMCPEYGIYHTRYPQHDQKFHSNENPHFIAQSDLKCYSLFYIIVQTLLMIYRCYFVIGALHPVEKD